MTIGPQTEAGPAVVPQRPTTEAERLEWLVRLCEGLVMSPSGWTTSKLRDALAPAVRTWAAETAALLAEARAEVERMVQRRDAMAEALRSSQDELAATRARLAALQDLFALSGHRIAESEARDRVAQLEEALASAHKDLEIERSATVDVAESMAEAQQRHAVEMGEERELSAVLARAYVRERQRLGRGGGA